MVCGSEEGDDIKFSLSLSTNQSALNKQTACSAFHASPKREWSSGVDRRGLDDSTTPFSLSPARLRLCFDSIYCAVYTANLLIIVTHRARPETYASRANTRDGERERGGGGDIPCLVGFFLLVFRFNWTVDILVCPGSCVRWQHLDGLTPTKCFFLGGEGVGGKSGWWVSFYINLGLAENYMGSTELLFKRVQAKRTYKEYTVVIFLHKLTIS